MSSGSPVREPLAIVGMACRFPGKADGAEAFWRMLCEGVDAICDVPADRWDVRKFYDPDPDAPGRTYTLQGGFLRESIWEFDAGFFGISPREAAIMDPQQRLLLEVTWEALEHAGFVLDDAQRRRMGVYVGAFCFDNALQQMGLASRDAIFTHSATSASMTMLSNRISYVFDLGGPCFTVDTACSSSLVATHLGCRAVWDGDCDIAVIGGVNVMLRPESTILEAKGGFLARDARCRAFDAAASGYVRAEGAGIVVVRPLSAALACGDRILALVRATGVNHDGRTTGITVPNGEAQEALIRSVCRDAGIEPREIGYVEAHGTGTPVGDPIEASALGRTIGGMRPERPVWVGSVKTNLGHLEAAAGVAGLMKAALCLAHRRVPPHLHLVTPNPKIDVDGLGLRFPTQVEPLTEGNDRFAAINSFGYGGTNAHVILERAPEPVRPASAPSGEAPWLLPLSARSERAVASFARALAAQIEGDADRPLPVVGHALAVRRFHHDHRAVVLAPDREQLLARLADIAAGTRNPALRTGRAVGRRKLAFVYTGMGAQSWGMGRGLYRASSVFRAAIDACERAWQRAGGVGLRALFDPSEDLARHAGEPMPEPQDAQPANLALQVGITAMLRAHGLAPDGIVGHSVGEIAAAWAASVLTLEQAFELTLHRCRLQQEQLGRGTMLALAAPAPTARKQILELAPDVEIAAFNDGESVTLGGAQADLERIARWAEGRGIRAQFLKVGVAYHTSQMAPIEQRFVAAIRNIGPAAPEVPLYSTVTGDRTTAKEQTPAYWWRNARDPVLLADALASLRRDGFTAFVEVGPHGVLGTSILREIADATAWPSQRRGADEISTLLIAVADAYCAGADLAWDRLYPTGDPAVRAPRYPFERQKLWRETAASRSDRLVEELHPLLHERLPSALPSWRTTLNERFLPWLPDHRVGGVAIFPAAGYVAAAIAAAALTDRGNAVEDMAFVRPLESLPQTPLQIDLDPRDGRLTFHSLARGDSAAWHFHAGGRLPDGRLVAGPAIDHNAIRARCPTEIDVDRLYRTLAAQGLEYGPAFRCIRAMAVGQGEAVVTLDCADAEADRYLLHPALLDAAFHAMLGVASERERSGTFVPTHLHSVRVHARLGGKTQAHVRIRRASSSTVLGDIVLFDEDGRRLVDVEGVRCQRLGGPYAGDAAKGWLYAWQWEEAREPALERPAGERWVVVVDDPAKRGEAGATPSIVDAASVVPGLELVFMKSAELAVRMPDIGDVSGVLDLRSAYLDSTIDPTGEAACLRLLQLVGHLPSAEHRPTRLVIATRGAVPVGDEPVEPAAGAVWSLGRVIMTERPGLEVKLVDLDKAALESGRALAELWTTGGEDETAVRGGQRHVPRLDRWRPPPPVTAESTLDTPVRLELASPGVLDSFHWVPDQRRKPGPGEIEMRVHRAALNFKDMMKALNMLSAAYLETTFIGDHLGMECAGTVVAVGEGVTEYATGDEVIAIDTNGCFRSYHTVSTGYAAKKPSRLTFAAAPSLIAYVTPYYAMKYLANVQPGETVLVHSASGGVGMAAISIARWLGAKVLATAGSEAKRRILRERGVEPVFHSRSLDFAEAVKSATGGAGVDVVINSLAGEAARKSLAALAPYGRFIEIGKKDIADGGTLGLADFDRNLMYVAVDTDRMGKERPKLFRKLIDEVLALLDHGDLAPIPTQEFPAREVDEAFRTMARALHVGKIVVDLEAGTVPTSTRPHLAVRPDRTWLVTGGLGGFGLEVARWLVEHRGARELVLVGRTGDSRPEARIAVERMRALGARVVVEALDVADRAAVTMLVARIAAGPAPLQGIIHAAMVLDDGMLETCDAARLAAVMRPKALGAWNLHEASRSLRSVEAFIAFSSVATFIGNAGQAAYVAANGFLDALAWKRRQLGLPALTVNWGAIADVGVVARQRGTAAYLENIGILGLDSASCTEALDQLLDEDAVQVGVADMNWPRWAEASHAVARSPRFGRLVVVGAPGRGADLPAVAKLRQLGQGARLPAMTELVREHLARVTHQAVANVDLALSLDNMGVDSLMVLEFGNALRADLGVELSAMALMLQGVTVGHVAEQVLASLLPEEQPASTIRPSVPVDVDAMTEGELDALLAAEGVGA